MGNLKLFIAGLWFLSLFGCGSNNGNKTNTTTQSKSEIQEGVKVEHTQEIDQVSFKPDTVYKSVKSLTDGNFSYAVYLPDTGVKLPVLAMFDPHADGSLPLNNYKATAKKFGFALIASNNSQNGLSQNDYMSILGAFYNDLKNQFSGIIDTSAVFCAGFSGGGRVASIFASIYKIPVVISAGAGTGGQKSVDFNFIGFAGNKDFNFMELFNLDNQLAQISKKDHYVEFFDGIHEWPPQDVYTTAFYYLDFYLMKNKKKQVDDEEISRFESEINNQIKSTKSYLQKANLLKKLAVFLGGLKDVAKYKSELSDVESSKQYRSELHEMMGIFDEEHRLQAAYSQALLNKPAGWWKDKMKEFEKNIKTLPRNESLMYERLRNYLSLAAYMGINSYLKQGNVLYAGQLLEIYKIIDPENPEIPNLEAQINSMK